MRRALVIGDGRLVGESAEDRGVDVVEGVPVPSVDLDRAERPVVADDRGDDEVADPGPRRPSHRPSSIVRELAGEVVAGGMTRRSATAVPDRPSPRRRRARPERVALVLGQPGVVGQLEDAGSRG